MRPAAAGCAVSAALTRAFLAVDDEILAFAAADGFRGGSTAVVVLTLGSTLYAAHAGDSRAVACCRGGVAAALTSDHKPDQWDERARVLAAGGRVEHQGVWRVICEPHGGRPGCALAVSRCAAAARHPLPPPAAAAASHPCICSPSLPRPPDPPAAPWATCPLSARGTWWRRRRTSRAWPWTGPTSSSS